MRSHHDMAWAGCEDAISSAIAATNTGNAQRATDKENRRIGDLHCCIAGSSLGAFPRAVGRVLHNRGRGGPEFQQLSCLLGGSGATAGLRIPDICTHAGLAMRRRRATF
jgi:hypothetical protein